MREVMIRVLGLLRGLVRVSGLLMVLVGVGVTFLPPTVLAVPLALLLNDPRWVGLLLVAVGLFLVFVSGWIGQGQPLRPLWTWVLRGAVIVAVVGTAWTFATSQYELAPAEFENGEVTLRGTLVSPDGPGPHPAVVFMHGSGPERGALWFHLADRFARAGVASLIYDKRGSGASEGGNPRDPYPDLASDAVAAIGWLKDQPAIDSSEIGIFGISEGGWTAPLAASMASEEVAFLIVVSGTGAAPEAENLYSIQTQLEDRAIGAEGIARALDLRIRVNDYYRTGEGKEDLQSSVRQVEGTDWFEAAGGYLPRATEIFMYGSEEWEQHMTFLGFDAVPLIEGLDISMLFIHGARDRSYPAEVSVDRLNEVAAQPGKDVIVLVYPDADHAIFTRYLPWPKYAPGYIDEMVSWVLDRTDSP